MTYQKHTTHTDALDTLGTIITENEKRDAIHLAVYPCKAGELLRAGDHVGLRDGVAVRVTAGDGVGIVDPFIIENVREVRSGEWFWLVVYPRQIASLRHVWEHDAFPPSGETDTMTVIPAEPTPAPREVSEAWIRDWMSSSSYDGPSNFDTLIEGAIRGAHNGYFTVYDSDASGPIPTEFWQHLNTYTGEHFNPYDAPEYFSCSC